MRYKKLAVPFVFAVTLLLGTSVPPKPAEACWWCEVAIFVIEAVTAHGASEPDWQPPPTDTADPAAYDDFYDWDWNYSDGEG